MAKLPGLTKRGGVYYFRMRVPQDVATQLGRSEIKESLRTCNFAEAKLRCSERVLHWHARFDRLRKAINAPDPDQESAFLTEDRAIRLVQDYVARRDREWRQRVVEDGPENAEEQEEMLFNAELPIQMLTNLEDPRGHELVTSLSSELLKDKAVAFGGLGLSYAQFAELLERALTELYRRQAARLRHDYSREYFDYLFAPAHNGTPSVPTFKELIKAYFEQYKKEAKLRKIDQKRVDKVETSLKLIEEMLGAETCVRDITYDACLSFLDALARVPKNRRKFYPKLSVSEAVAAAAQDGRAAMSYATQQTHIQTLNAVLKLAVKKGYLSSVPSADLSPYAEKIPAAEKRQSFTVEQLNAIFSAPIYTGCQNDGAGFAKLGPNVIRRARFWVPLICLFTGMRANEVCQLYLQDLKTSDAGTVYIDIIKNQVDKKIKNETSRRVFPLHPELLKMGFPSYVEGLRKKGETRLFPELKPDTYGYYSASLSDWFSDSFLKSIMEKEKGYSFHSLRHNFRDALRLINAPDWVLQALGGWNQGTKVSDNYGSTAWPDQLYEWVSRVAYEGLDVSHLYVGKNIK